MLPKLCRAIGNGGGGGAPLSLLLVMLISHQQIIIIAGSTAAAEATSQQQHAHSPAPRKSIVFDLKTPKVFYCPQEKQADLVVDKMIVKAQPLDRLCEFGGKPKPRSTPSDCYNDVDETEFACDEKRRFMIRLDLASEGLDSGTEGIDDLDYILAKGTASSSSSSSQGSGKKKALPKEKKY